MRTTGIDYIIILFSKKNHVAQILHLSFVSLKEAAIRNCPHYAKILTYDAFVKLLKDIPVEDPL